MATPTDIAALHDLATEAGFERIATVAGILERARSNPGIRDQLAGGRRFAIDVLDLLNELPGRLGFASAEHFVFGYQALGDDRSKDEAADLEQWNDLCRQARALAGMRADADYMELHRPLDALFDALATFTGKRYRLHELSKEARASRAPSQC